jgi:hypothetical protein
MVPRSRLARFAFAAFLLMAGIARLSGQDQAVADTEPAEGLHTITVGGRDLLVPNPAGFERGDGVKPDYDGIIESYIAATNRLLANFLIPEEVEMLRGTETPAAERTFNLQTLRKLENLNFGPSGTKSLLAQSRGEIQKQRNEIEKLTNSAVKAGNDKLKEAYDTDLELSLSGTTILDFFEDSDTALGFSIVSNLTVDKETERVITAAMMTTVNSRLLYFYATSPFKTNTDREWAETHVKEWAQATLAANPVAANGGILGLLSGVSKPGLIGGVVGGIVALIVVMTRASKKRQTGG